MCTLVNSEHTWSQHKLNNIFLQKLIYSMYRFASVPPHHASLHLHDRENAHSTQEAADRREAKRAFREGVPSIVAGAAREGICPRETSPKLECTSGGGGMEGLPSRTRKVRVPLPHAEMFAPWSSTSIAEVKHPFGHCLGAPIGVDCGLCRRNMRSAAAATARQQNVVLT